MSLTAAAEACASSGGEGGAAVRVGKATSTTLAMGVANRTELDASLISACASAWKPLRALTRGMPGGVGVGPLAALLGATPSPTDAVRLACKAVAHAARIIDADARVLTELGAHGGPAFLQYAATHCPVCFRLRVHISPAACAHQRARHCCAGHGARTAQQRLLPHPRSCGGPGGVHGGACGAFADQASAPAFACADVALRVLHT